MCPGCRAVLYAKRLTRNLKVCPECGRHLPLTADERIGQLFDRGSVEPLFDEAFDGGDPLGFVDTVPYPDRLRAARAKTGMAEAVQCVRGTIGGHRTVAAVMDFRFMGGSLGTAVGELITRSAEIALATRTPLLIVTASGGARMQEGALALMQMAKTSQSLAALDEAGVFTVVLVTDPTYGGVAASYAMLGDVIVAESGARLGFAGPRVIEQTIGERLPRGFQTAEFLLEHGMIDLVRAREAIRPTLVRLLSIGIGHRLPADAVEPEPAGRPAASPPSGDAWRTVRQARAYGRPTTLDYAALIAEEFEELHGDRLGGDCPAIVGGLARIAGMPLVLIGHQKGRTPEEMRVRRYGMPEPSGYRKAARLMRLAAKLRLPVLTLVDTPGAYPGLAAEEQGQAVAIAENLRLMSGLPVPVVTVITGEGGSGGALALAVANRVLMLDDAVYSVISPEGCAAILWNDPAAAGRAAAALRLDARSLLALGVVDDVIPGVASAGNCGEIDGPAGVAGHLRAAVVAQLRELAPLDPAELVSRRRARFRSYGAATPAMASAVAQPAHRPDLSGG
jgi:acetyl-CoA carboxylase carboxyl transferase subunit beta